MGGIGLLLVVLGLVLIIVTWTDSMPQVLGIIFGQPQ